MISGETPFIRPVFYRIPSLRALGRTEEIVLAQNSHELVTRFLSALDWSRGRHLVTTEGEFHSMDRQLRRLGEEGVEIDFVPVEPLSTLASRMASMVRRDTIGLLASTVLFQSASIVPNLTEAVEAAHRVGAQVLLDAYHGFRVVPQTIKELGPDPIFITAGGYKYAKWGEGCCWMRVPPGCQLRPVFTGWFSDFAHLDAPRSDAIGYGPAANRFAGSTYDPASHYRAAKVVEFFIQQGLTGEILRARYLRQTERLIAGLPELELLTPREPESRAGVRGVSHCRCNRNRGGFATGGGLCGRSGRYLATRTCAIHHRCGT